MLRLKPLYRRLKTNLGLTNRTRYPLLPNELFQPELITHFGHHKCLTVYYKRIMDRLAHEFGFLSLATNPTTFAQEAIERSGPRVIRLNNSSQVPWDKLPPYRGSHFIRDPRDIVVSGYHYHLWAEEAWIRKPNFNWQTFVKLPQFQYVEPDPLKHPQNESYQEYLQNLAPEAGMILELLTSKHRLDEMGRWQFGNSHILEMRYEDIIGNEAKMFDRLFRHYDFHPRLHARGLEVVEQLSLKNQKRGDQKHLRRGDAKQWEQEFTPLARQLFKQTHGDLLIQLGYERDLNW